jgi:hypothetical protein
MLFEYVASGLQPGGAATVWSRFPLQPLAAGVLTPFSFSVLAELASRGWFAHYDRLGFAPTPRARLVRQHKGHAFLNLSLSAQIEADQAGLEPTVLQVNQQPQPIATWEKPSFLAAFKVGRAQKKLDESVDDYTRRMDAITEKARHWYLKTQELRWSQAEVLQVMEEIERMGMEPMAAYLAARAHLERTYAQLLAGLEGRHSTEQGLLLINNALCDMQGLVESEIGDALLHLADVMQSGDQLAWLKAGHFDDWRTALTHKRAQEALWEFMDAYGHRALHAGEMAQPRWQEEMSIVARGLVSHIEHPRKHPTKLPSSGNLQKLVEQLSPAMRKPGQAAVARLRVLHKLQSTALHALAYIQAGTRRWALAAAHEAMADERLTAPEDVFFFELEEVKQMMTGEWNVSARDEIHATAQTRRQTYAAWQETHAPEILIGETEGYVTHRGLPGVAGHATGPLRRWGTSKKNGCSGAIVGADVLDSGYALALPIADGFVASGGTPLDPFVAAARMWHHPVVVGLGELYPELVDGAYTTLDTTLEGVDVRQ